MKQAFGLKKDAHKLRGLLALSVLVISTWFLSPYFWSPTIDDIEIDLLTMEADALFSKCEDEHDISDFMPPTIQLSATTSPYIFHLHARGREWIEFFVFCEEVIHIPMWNDWWSYNAGLYIVKDGAKPPRHFEQTMSKIGSRVYRWEKYLR